MAGPERNLQINGTWFTLPPNVALVGDEGGSTVRRTLNGKHVVVTSGFRTPSQLVCSGGSNDVISVFDANRIFAAFDDRTEFSLRVLGVLPDGSGIEVPRARVLERPVLTLVANTDGSKRACLYSFTITLLSD